MFLKYLQLNNLDIFAPTSFVANYQLLFFGILFTNIYSTFGVKLN